MADDLRELLQRKADSLTPSGPAPARMLRRARRRASISLIGGVIVLAALAFGSYSGLAALVSRPLHGTPGDRASIPASPHPAVTLPPSGESTPPTCRSASMAASLASSQ